MTRKVRACVFMLFSAVLIASIGAIAPPADAVPHLTKSSAALDDEVAALRGGGSFSYTIEPLTPSTQMDIVVDHEAPYFDFLLTNTGPDPDSYFMEVTGVDDPINWFPQVCIGVVCYANSVTYPLAGQMNPTETAIVGVNVVPFFVEGVDTFTYTIRSTGNPSLESSFELTLYSGSAAVDVRPISGLDGSGYELRQNTPNPVRAATSIGFALSREESIDLRVYDISGRVVRTLSEGVWSSGSHALAWDGKNDSGASVPAGVYFYRLVTPEGSLAKRLTVIR